MIELISGDTTSADVERWILKRIDYTEDII